MYMLNINIVENKNPKKGHLDGDLSRLGSS